MKQSKVNVLSDPLKMTRDILKVSRRRQWPLIPSLAVTPAPGQRLGGPPLHLASSANSKRILGPTYPIVLASEDQALVLLPLCDPIDVHRSAVRLANLPTKLSIREESVSVSQLIDLAPFKCVGADADGVVVASSGDLTNLVHTAPNGGWSLVRAGRHRKIIDTRHATQSLRV